MSTMELVAVETLSDDDAVARLFELVQDGSLAKEELQQLDAIVYARLVQAYERAEPPVLQNRIV